MNIVYVLIEPWLIVIGSLNYYNSLSHLLIDKVNPVKMLQSFVEIIYFC